MANFKVKLPEAIILEGTWEIALVEIQYSHTWSTIRKGVEQTILHGTQPATETGFIAAGYYDSVPDLVKALNACIKKEERDNIKFTYNKRSRKVTADVRKGRIVGFTGDIAAVLGFEQESWLDKKTVGSYAADINAGFSSMFVYCNLVTDQIVGDKQVPLLRTVQVEGKYGDTITKTYPNPLYTPVGIKNFETVEIDISDQTGRRVPFEYGHSVYTLHLRPNHSIYF